MAVVLEMTHGGMAPMSWAMADRGDIIDGKWAVLQDENSMTLCFTTGVEDQLLPIEKNMIRSVSIAQTSPVSWAVDIEVEWWDSEEVTSRSGTFLLVAPSGRVQRIFDSLRIHIVGSESYRIPSSGRGLQLLVRARVLFWIGAGSGLVAGVGALAVLGSGGGGIVWTGGFILFGILLVASIQEFGAAARYDTRAGAAEVVIMASAFATILLIGIAVLVNFLRDHESGSTPADGSTEHSEPADPESVGSCWTEADSSGYSTHVPCDSSAAAYKVVREADSEYACPPSSVANLEGDDGSVLCLAEL